METRKSSNGIITTIVITVLLVTIAALIVVIAYLLKSKDSGNEIVAEDKNTRDAAIEVIESLEVKEDPKRPKEWYGQLESSGPVDRDVKLSEYEKRCPAVYAWIEIPGTDIDYPIAYCEDAVAPFYFTHDINGNESDAGMIITDSLNGKTFSDPETLIYGQSPDDGTMFFELARFRDADFFEDNDTINIYLDDAKLIYRIYACYIGSSDHILVNNDFGDPVQFMSYFDSIEEVRDLSANIRQEAKPIPGDYAIALVTHCQDESKRLFVHATLSEVKY